MGTFVTAYLIVWLGVVLYVMRLGAEQRRLLRTLEGLQSQIEQSEKPERPTTAAA